MYSATSFFPCTSVIFSSPPFCTLKVCNPWHRTQSSWTTLIISKPVCVRVAKSSDWGTYVTICFYNFDFFPLIFLEITKMFVVVCSLALWSWHWFKWPWRVVDCMCICLPSAYITMVYPSYLCFITLTACLTAYTILVSFHVWLLHFRLPSFRSVSSYIAVSLIKYSPAFRLFFLSAAQPNFIIGECGLVQNHCQFCGCSWTSCPLRWLGLQLCSKAKLAYCDICYWKKNNCLHFYINPLKVIGSNFCQTQHRTKV